MATSWAREQEDEAEIAETRSYLKEKSYKREYWRWAFTADHLRRLYETTKVPTARDCKAAATWRLALLQAWQEKHVSSVRLAKGDNRKTSCHEKQASSIFTILLSFIGVLKVRVSDAGKQNSRATAKIKAARLAAQNSLLNMSRLILSRHVHERFHKYFQMFQTQSSAEFSSSNVEFSSKCPKSHGLRLLRDSGTLRPRRTRRSHRSHRSHRSRRTRSLARSPRVGSCRGLVFRRSSADFLGRFSTR